MRRNINPTNPDSRVAYILSSSKLAPIHRFASWERWGLLGLGILLLALLGVARSLVPAVEGFGTHRQLGLPGCSAVSIFGIRCPGCGMTTSWAHCVRGDIEGAMRANAGGAILCLLSMACSPILIAMSISGRPSRGGWFSIASVSAFCVAIGVAMIDWVIRLASNA